MNADLLNFTRHALDRGVSRQEVTDVLSRAGWPAADIKAALDAFADINFPIAVPRPRPYLSAREVFIYSVLFVSLYYSAYSLGALIFDLINRALPDPLDNQWYVGNALDRIRWNVSSLLVSFPLFYLTFASVNRAILRDPTKRGSLPRRWLTYLTLFVAAVSLTGDVATLLYNALGGELTLRFLLKVVTVAVIAGGTFAYFFVDIRKEETV